MTRAELIEVLAKGMEDPNKVPGRPSKDVQDSDMEDYERDKLNADEFEYCQNGSNNDADDVLYDILDGDYKDIERD